MTQNNKLTKEQISILDFWHKIEFFLPYDLQETLSTIKKKKQIYQQFTLEEISTLSTEQLWQNPYQGKDEVVVSFELFIGIYDKDELAKQLKDLLNVESKSENVRFIDNTNKKYFSDDGKGLSCCAKISLDEFGQLDPYKPRSIEISTAPWAIGQIRQYEGNVTCLDFDQFNGEMDLLKHLLADFLRKQPVPQITKDNPQFVLNGKSIAQLFQIVSDWVGFQTENRALPAIYIYPRKGKLQKKKENSNTELKPFNVEVEQIQISILNSFFAQDLAKVIQVAQKKESISSTLRSYLSKTSKRIDLYNTQEGKACIIEHLKPEYLNRGHWFSENHHHMSLMQQFAINTIFKEVDKKQQTQSLFSVNGPPGTGKTTLLRDIFTENIVRRASVLANYKSVKDTFKENVNVEFRSSLLNLAVLQDDLTGYEMVVTSSNNAAVQNISEELPQVKALGKNWQDKQQPKVSYLQSVARNLTACKKQNNKKEYIKLDPQKSSWGLIACILGRKEKLQFFAEQFTEQPDHEAKGFIKDYFDCIYSWRKKYNGLTFEQARKLFQNKQKEVNTHIELLTQYMNTVLECKKLSDFDVKKYLIYYKKQIDRAISEIETLKQEREIIEYQKPNLLIRLFKLKKYREYLLQIKRNYQSQKTQKEQKILAEDALEATKIKQQKKEALYQELASLQEKLEFNADPQKTKVHTPTDMLENIEQDEWQIYGFWSDENLNQKRAELFEAALILHEAWIVESIKFGFSGNILAIKNLLKGQQLQGETDKIEQTAKIIWQSLFMMVPVASTTFASFGNLFRYLGANSLGWVFVDEAGQAIPQAAVGALWRAKNAVVVGDPLQIEPVFTTPEELTDVLLKASNINVNFDVAPHKTSVQTLADKANPYGASLDFDGEETWIGSPLRVHRRCFEPMFSISNHIAYQGKMVFGLNQKEPDKDHWLMGKSAWLHLSKGKDQANAEIKLIVEIFRQLCLQRYEKRELPPVYIISPFKEICEQIRNELKNNKKLWETFSVKDTEWLEKNVGTVHTFQGKENSIVFLVLGRNSNDLEKATKLVTKPNLLNVAATRAKEKFFIIGDHNLWKERYECFKRASPILREVVDAYTFLDKLKSEQKTYNSNT